MSLLFVYVSNSLRLRFLPKVNPMPQESINNSEISKGSTIDQGGTDFSNVSTTIISVAANERTVPSKITIW